MTERRGRGVNARPVIVPADACFCVSIYEFGKGYWTDLPWLVWALCSWFRSHAQLTLLSQARLVTRMKCWQQVLVLTSSPLPSILHCQPAAINTRL
jgi:hypothetical protein